MFFANCNALPPVVKWRFFCLFVCFWQCHKGTIVSSMCFCFGSSLSLCAPWAWYLLQILHWRQLVHLLIIMVLAVCPHWCFSQSPLLQLWGIRHFNVLVSYKSIQVTVSVTVSFCALRQLFCSSTRLQALCNLQPACPLSASRWHASLLPHAIITCITPLQPVRPGHSKTAKLSVCPAFFVFCFWVPTYWSLKECNSLH